MFSDSGNDRGYSTPELLVALAVMAIVMAMAVPDYSGLKQPLDRLNARSIFLQDLKRAQAESITIGCRGILEVTGSGTGYRFGCDYLPYDAQADPVSDEFSLQRTLPAGITLNTSRKIIFNSRGQSVDANFIFANVDVELRENNVPFDTGTLLGTGVFEYD